MGARTWVGAAVIAGVLAGAVPASGSSAAATGDRTVTKAVTVDCTLSPPHGPPFPDRRTYSVTTTVPGRVAAGSTFSIHVSIPYPVSPEAQIGAGSVTGGSGASPALATVAAAPGAAAIAGAPEFTATGAPGTKLTWRLGSFGQQAHIGSITIIEICTPTHAFTLSRTKIT